METSKVDDKQRLLELVDDVLLPLGFTRGKRSQEWSKRFGSDRLWLHLNFGLSVINPAIGVEYQDLKHRWRDLPGATYGTMVMLSDLFDPSRVYTLKNDCKGLLIDLKQKGLPALAELQDRNLVVERLKSSDPNFWPVISLSHKIRLLPLLLCGLGKEQEALTIGRELAAIAAGQDQIQPPYDQFLVALSSAIAG